LKIFLAGIDEAGLGPILGPLVVSATVWQFDLSDEESEKLPNIWKLFPKLISNDTKSLDKIIITDSKKLHKPKKIKPIEETALTMISSLEKTSEKNLENISNFLKTITQKDILKQFDKYPWFANLKKNLPIEANFDKCFIRGKRLSKQFNEMKAKFVFAKSRIVPAGEFNQLIDEYQNKSVAHWSIIAELVNEIIGKFSPLRIVIDKQGGRDFYADLLTAKKICKFSTLIQFHSL